MMISPEGYLEEIKNKSYNELLIERSELLKEIMDFEKNNNLSGDNYEYRRYCF